MNTAKKEAALCAFHNSFGERTRNVMAYVDELIAEWRANPPPPPRPSPFTDHEDYELESRPGETLRDGMLSPGT
jgi:hypothetical protein